MIVYGSSLSPYVRKTLAFGAEKGLALENKVTPPGAPDPEFLAWLDRQQRRKSPPRPRPADPSDGSTGKTGADGNEDPDDGRGGVA